jgi:hypothetical protein
MQSFAKNKHTNQIIYSNYNQPNFAFRCSIHFKVCCSILNRYKKKLLNHEIVSLYYGLFYFKPYGNPTQYNFPLNDIVYEQTNMKIQTFIYDLN